MSSTGFRFVLRGCACALALIAAAALVACGDSADSEESSREFGLTTSKNGSLTVTGPKSSEAGLAEITYVNEGEFDTPQQLVRVEGEHSPEELLEGLARSLSGQGTPEWLIFAGGVRSLAPSERASVTQVLRPGSYYAFDTVSDPSKAKPLLMTEVTGEESDEEIEGKATIEATEYAFSTDPLPSGPTEIVFKNAGTQPHHLTIAPLKPNATAKDVEDLYKTEDVIPPFDTKAIKSTAVLEGGESQLLTLDLEPGRYVAICFITDREGGKGHHLRGMIDEVEVK